MAPPIPWHDRLAEYKHKKDNDLPMGAAVRDWVYRQRISDADGTLSDERKEKLNSVGFEWITIAIGRKPYDHDAWNRNFTLLENHHLENQSCRGPFQERRLEYWVHNQRHRLKDKESLNETQQERWARLDTLGFWDNTGTEQQHVSQGPSDSGLDPTAHASRATTSVSSNSDGEMGQQGSSIVRVTVRVMARFAGELTSRATHAYLVFHFACISKPANGIRISDSGLDPTAHASRATASVNSNSDGEMEQSQHGSSIVRGTVRVMARFARALTSRATHVYLVSLWFHFQACERYHHWESGMRFDRTVA
jgi:Helicase associated domain